MPQKAFPSYTILSCFICTMYIVVMSYLPVTQRISLRMNRVFLIDLVQAASAAQISLKRSYTEVDTEKKELQLNSKARKYLRFQRHLEKKCE